VLPQHLGRSYLSQCTNHGVGKCFVFLLLYISISSLKVCTMVSAFGGWLWDGSQVWQSRAHPREDSETGVLEGEQPVAKLWGECVSQSQHYGPSFHLSSNVLWVPLYSSCLDSHVGETISRCSGSWAPVTCISKGKRPVVHCQNLHGWSHHVTC
jgi:hypothetical protein